LSEVKIPAPKPLQNRGHILLIEIHGLGRIKPK